MVVIVGGGHMGKKMYDYLHGVEDVIMIDTPINKGNHAIVKEVLKTSENKMFYIATPDEYHIQWLMWLPKGAKVLIEKPVVNNLQEFAELKRKVEKDRIELSCHLPWREVVNKFTIPKVTWHRNKGWEYKERKTPVGIDIGVHMFDLVGTAVGREQLYFDSIIENSMWSFKGKYKDVVIELKIGGMLNNNAMLFGHVYDSVISDNAMYDVYNQWLGRSSGKFEFATIYELEWLQHLLEQVSKEVK